MRSVSVCVPVLRRYDLLRELLLSLHDSTVAADVTIVDNGMNQCKVQEAVAETVFAGVPVFVYTPTAPMGVAESWNWLARNTEGQRIISNDDVKFHPESLAAFLDADPTADLVFGKHGYSCFLIKDSCFEKVGFFDETISPGYAYFEDCDYARRMEQAVGVAHQVQVECKTMHGGSQTIAVGTARQTAEHHRRFAIAHANYMRKWPGVHR